MFKLERDNYYSREADLEYMSCSQYQAFLKCEAAELARLRGIYEPMECSEALIVGNYVHTYLESEAAHVDFCKSNYDRIFKTSKKKASDGGGDCVVTGKYAAFARADEMIAALMNCKAIRKFIDMPGEREKIMVGELFGLPWKIRLDKWLPTRNTVIDYKTCANFYDLRYNQRTGMKECFIEYYGYMMRAAVYSEIVKQNTGIDVNPHFLLICVSKQDIPDKDIFRLDCNDERYAFELAQVKADLARISKVKRGETAPRRCGKCEYCRATKKITNIKPYWSLLPEGEVEPEEDFALLKTANSAAELRKAES